MKKRLIAVTIGKSNRQSYCQPRQNDQPFPFLQQLRLTCDDLSNVQDQRVQLVQSNVGLGKDVEKAVQLLDGLVTLGVVVVVIIGIHGINSFLFLWAGFCDEGCCIGHADEG